MAQQTLKKLKYNGSEIIVEAAYRDGLGRTISDTYLTSVAWSDVTSKPFTSVDSGSGKDFTISSNVLKLNHTQLATKYVELSTYNTAINGLQPKHANLTSISGLSTSSTGLIKMTNGVASLDTNTYATTSAVAAGYQPLDADLTAIAALTGTSGLLKKTAANTWSLDTNTYATQTWVNNKGYLTSHQSLANYYTKTQVDDLVSQRLEYVTAEELPTASADTMYKIYLIPTTIGGDGNAKEEWLTVRSGSEGSYTYAWEHIGSTNMDLSGYVRTYDFEQATKIAANAGTLFPKNELFVWKYTLTAGSTVSYMLYTVCVSETGLGASSNYTVEIESIQGGARWTATVSKTGNTTFGDVMVNANHQRYACLKTDSPLSPGQFNKTGAIIVSADYGIYSDGAIKDSAYTFDASTTTVSNTENKVPLSQAVYAELAKKQNNLTFSTGLTNSSNTVTLNTATADALGGIKIGSGLSISSGVVSVSSAPTATNATNATNWTGNPFTVTDVTLDY